VKAEKQRDNLEKSAGGLGGEGAAGGRAGGSGVLKKNWYYDYLLPRMERLGKPKNALVRTHARQDRLNWRISRGAWYLKV